MADPRRASPPESPRLRRLQRDLGRAPKRSLARFWREIERRGTPLVEPVARNDPRAVGGSTDPDRTVTDHDHLVTLLFRGKSDVRTVEVQCSFGSKFPTRLELLPGTDVWYRTWRLSDRFRGSYRFVVNLPERGPLSNLSWIERTRRSITDPLNPRRFLDPTDPGDPGGPHGFASSEIVMPRAPDRAWLREGFTGRVQGRLVEERIESRALRRQFPRPWWEKRRIPGRHDRRRVWVYLPGGEGAGAGPRPVDPRNLVVFLDGFDYAHVLAAPATLEALARRGSIGPTAALFVEHGPKNYRGVDLWWNEPFGEFLADELLPWARGRFGWSKLSATRTVLAGASLGGQTALLWALRRPEVFGAVLSQSGSFQNAPDPFREEPNWTARWVADHPRVPIRVHLEVGLRETVLPFGATRYPTILSSNRHLRDALRAKGYPLSYSEFDGGHDDGCWRQTLADGLVALLGRPSARPKR